MPDLYRTSLERVTNAWRVGPYVFSEIEGHGFASIPGPVYRFEIDGRPANHEAYETIDMALASAVGERWTGPRGAGGSGVETAAGWFLTMIGHTPAPVLDEMLPPAVEPKDPHCPDRSCMGAMNPAMFHGRPTRTGWTCGNCERDWEIDPTKPAEVTER